MWPHVFILHKLRQLESEKSWLMLWKKDSFIINCEDRTVSEILQVWNRLLLTNDSEIVFESWWAELCQSFLQSTSLIFYLCETVSTVWCPEDLCFWYRKQMRLFVTIVYKHTLINYYHDRTIFCMGKDSVVQIVVTHLARWSTWYSFVSGRWILLILDEPDRAVSPASSLGANKLLLRVSYLLDFFIFNLLQKSKTFKRSETVLTQ